jgi:hypothetical protein
MAEVWIRSCGKSCCGEAAKQRERHEWQIRFETCDNKGQRCFIFFPAARGSLLSSHATPCTSACSPIPSQFSIHAFKPAFDLGFPMVCDVLLSYRSVLPACGCCAGACWVLTTLQAGLSWPCTHSMWLYERAAPSKLAIFCSQAGRGGFVAVFPCCPSPPFRCLQLLRGGARCTQQGLIWHTAVCMPLVARLLQDSGIIITLQKPPAQLCVSMSV